MGTRTIWKKVWKLENINRRSTRNSWAVRRSTLPQYSRIPAQQQICQEAVNEERANKQACAARPVSQQSGPPKICYFYACWTAWHCNFQSPHRNSVSLPSENKLVEMWKPYQCLRDHWTAQTQSVPRESIAIVSAKRRVCLLSYLTGTEIDVSLWLWHLQLSLNCYGSRRKRATTVQTQKRTQTKWGAPFSHTKPNTITIWHAFCASQIVYGYEGYLKLCG